MPNLVKERYKYRDSRDEYSDEVLAHRVHGFRVESHALAKEERTEHG
jgi:hypothetical protein